MQEHLKQQHIPVKVYRTPERLMIAAPMAGEALLFRSPERNSQYEDNNQESDYYQVCH